MMRALLESEYGLPIRFQESSFMDSPHLLVDCNIMRRLRRM